MSKENGKTRKSIFNYAKIRKVRKALGWSQTQLADKLGVSRNHIGDIERGRISPRVAEVDRVLAFHEEAKERTK